VKGSILITVALLVSSSLSGLYQPAPSHAEVTIYNGPALAAPSHAAASTVPLQSLQIQSAHSVAAISGDTQATNNGHPLGSGLQIQNGNGSGDGNARFALNGNYTTLQGTLYGDDAGDSTGAVFELYDESDSTYSRPLYSYRATIDREHVRFSINVRGVKILELDEANSNAKIDVVASLTLGSAPAPSEATPPLESLRILSPHSVTLIPAGNFATTSGRPLTRGIQIQNGNGSGDGDGRIVLGGNYTTIRGTLYGDDGTDSTGATFLIYDDSDPTYQRPLYYYKATIDKEAVPFSIDVRGVNIIELGEADSNARLDIVANLTRGRAHVPATKTPPLESLRMLSPHSATLIAPGNYATNNGHALSRGIQLQNGNGSDDGYGKFVLNGSYRSLRGVVYGDDAGDSTGATFLVLDMSSPSHPRTLYKHTATIDKEAVSFNVSLRGVSILTIAEGDSNAKIDVVANLVHK